MSNLHEHFLGPYKDTNLQGHILKFEKNVTLEESMKTAMLRKQCGAFVMTDDNRTFYKTLSYEEAMNRLKEPTIVPGHTTYIKKEEKST